MRSYMRSLRAGMLLFVVWLVVFAALPAAAQEPAAATSRAGTRPVAEVLARIGKSARVTVISEPTFKERVPLPRMAATPETVEQQIAEIIKALPPGTTLTKLYLPDPPMGRTWKVNDVAAYAVAQTRLFGIRGTPPTGMVEILGQRLALAEAADIIARLKLRPVYLVSNSPPPASTGSSTNGLKEWMQMTPQQREEYAQQQAAQLLSADPSVRDQSLIQQGMVFRAMVQQMTPAQRQQLFQGMQQFFQGMGAPTAP